jgi:hypothetical protein
MPGGSIASLGNNWISHSIYQSITPAASVSGSSSSTSTYTIQGLLQNDQIDLYPQAALQALLSLGSIWVSAVNTLSIQWVNSSGSTSSSSPTAISCILMINRCTLSPYTLNSSNWPTALE